MVPSHLALDQVTLAYMDLSSKTSSGRVVGGGSLISIRNALNRLCFQKMVLIICQSCSNSGTCSPALSASESPLLIDATNYNLLRLGGNWRAFLAEVSPVTPSAHMVRQTAIGFSAITRLQRYIQCTYVEMRVPILHP